MVAGKYIGCEAPNSPSIMIAHARSRKKKNFLDTIRFFFSSDLTHELIADGGASKVFRLYLSCEKKIFLDVTVGLRNIHFNICADRWGRGELEYFEIRAR